jgi:hypothetical protein
MSKEDEPREVYQLHILLLQISPAIWRRLHMRSDSTIADLHYTLQIVMDWSDTHLHRFAIHGKEYGIAQPGGLWFRDNPAAVRLCDLHLRLGERFLYEYDLIDNWQHQIRLERKFPLHPNRSYPRCIAGARLAPPEGCGGPYGYLEQKQFFSLGHIGSRLMEMVEDEESRVADYREEAATMLYWLQADTFDRQAANKRLALYAAGGERRPEKVKILT